MHEVLVNRLGGLSLSRKSVVRLTDRPDMTLDVYRGRKTTIQQQQNHENFFQPNLLCFVLCYGFHVVRIYTDLCIFMRDTKILIKKQILIISLLNY